ncbi:MAG TPA: SRPBCC domain-containing protein [Puia sp.]|nr:SRPBCC domain-containing protein [Puia sp.]
MQKEINQTWFFRQSPGEVWEYLTQPELIEQWLMKADFQPVVGHKFRFTFQPKPGSVYEGVVNCEVLEVKPFTRLSYTWNGRTEDKSRSFHSTVVWTLVPKDSGTELQLRHNGLEFLDDILNHTNGWINCVKRLEEHINLTNAR